MDYNTICLIVGDLYLKSQQEVSKARTEAENLVEQLQEQLLDKEKLVQNLESELQRMTRGQEK